MQKLITTSRVIQHITRKKRETENVQYKSANARMHLHLSNYLNWLANAVRLVEGYTLHVGLLVNAVLHQIT